MASIPVVRETSSVPAESSSLFELAERIGSAAVLIAAAPVICLSAAALAISSGRSPLIAHRRVGWRGSTLWMLKLRTMWGEETGGTRCTGWIEYIDDPAGPQLKQPTDARVPNAFARFCRRHSLDELPQLLHVIRGEMSLVGPRPLTARELREHYGSDVPEVLDAKPGIAGLWQISGRNRLTYAERRKFDLELVRGRSARMYLRILAGSLAEVFKGANSW